MVYWTDDKLACVWLGDFTYAAARVAIKAKITNADTLAAALEKVLDHIRSGALSYGREVGGADIPIELKRKVNDDQRDAQAALNEYRR